MTYFPLAAGMHRLGLNLSDVQDEFVYIGGDKDSHAKYFKLKCPDDPHPKQKKNFMEDFEGPEKGGPEDRSSTEKVPVWTDVISKAELRNFRGKGFGKGGKGPGNEGKGGSIWKVLPQG